MSKLQLNGSAGEIERSLKVLFQKGDFGSVYLDKYSVPINSYFTLPNLKYCQYTAPYSIEPPSGQPSGFEIWLQNHC